MNVIWRRSNVIYNLFRIITQEIQKNTQFNYVSYSTTFNGSKLFNLQTIKPTYNVVRHKSKKVL